MRPERKSSLRDDDVFMVMRPFRIRPVIDYYYFLYFNLYGARRSYNISRSVNYYFLFLRHQSKKKRSMNQSFGGRCIYIMLYTFFYFYFLYYAVIPAAERRGISVLVYNNKKTERIVNQPSFQFAIRPPAYRYETSVWRFKFNAVDGLEAVVVVVVVDAICRNDFFVVIFETSLCDESVQKEKPVKITSSPRKSTKTVQVYDLKKKNSPLKLNRKSL